MAVSQNGWTANDPSRVSRRDVPGTEVELTVHNGPAGDLLLRVAALFDRDVQNIDNARGALDDWGYAERPIRGGTTLSNHASGTAIDLNATRWPLGSQPSVNLDDGQIKLVRQMIGLTGGVVRWGGDYSGRKDPMHFEINDGQTVRDCARALLVLTVAKTPASAGAAALPGLDVGSSGSAVLHLQQFLKRYAPSYAGGLVADGAYGPRTATVVREYQRRAGLPVVGRVGPRTNQALWQVGYRG